MVTGYDHLLFLAGVVFFVYRPVRQADSGRDRRRSCRRGRPAFRGGPSGGIRDRSALKVDAVELEIAPYDYVEYKYRLAQSAAMLFSWESSAAVIELDQKNNVLKMTTRDKGYPPVVEIDITPKTRIERDGRPTPRTALNRGVHVVVDALGDDVFSLEALTIRIVPAPK